VKKGALTATQRQALKLLDRGGFVKSRAGWHSPETGGVGAFNGQTVLSLQRRGLVRFKLRGNRPAAAYITPKGRRMLASVRTPEQLEMALAGAGGRP
jgi:hypothetical protein